MNLSYLVIGGGGTGGLIAGNLAQHNKNVTLVARGRHLDEINQNGLTIIRPNQQKDVIKNIKDYAQQTEVAAYDVIFVCVKSYSLPSILPVISSAASSKTLIIPILNSMQAGNYLRSKLQNVQVLDGCIYLTGYIQSPGVIVQNNNIFKIVAGKENVTENHFPMLPKLHQDMQEANIKFKYSPEIYSEIFEKIAFTSAFSAVGIYYQANAGEIQANAEFRQFFIRLSDELMAVARANGYKLAANFVEKNVAILDALATEFTTSLQKDLASHHSDEREQLIFDIVRMAQQHHVAVPYYEKVAATLGF